MTRPTKEQVEHCLKHTEGWQYLGSDTTMPGTGWEKFEVLAAEVRALREESQRLENRHVEQRGKFKEALESNEAYRTDNSRLHSRVGELAEIDRLRAELAEAQHVAAGGGRCDYWRENRELKDTIARVEAMPAKWRDKARQLDGYDVGMHEVRLCADELEAALRGKS